MQEQQTKEIKSEFKRYRSSISSEITTFSIFSYYEQQNKNFIIPGLRVPFIMKKNSDSTKNITFNNLTTTLGQFNSNVRIQESKKEVSKISTSGFLQSKNSKNLIPQNPPPPKLSTEEVYNNKIHPAQFKQLKSNKSTKTTNRQISINSRYSDNYRNGYLSRHRGHLLKKNLDNINILKTETDSKKTPKITEEIKILPQKEKSKENTIVDTESEDDETIEDNFQKFLSAYDNIESSKYVTDNDIKKLSEKFVEAIYEPSKNLENSNHKIELQPNEFVKLHGNIEEEEKLKKIDDIKNYEKFANRYAENFEVFEELMKKVNHASAYAEEDDENLKIIKNLQERQKLINSLMKRNKQSNSRKNV